MKRSWARLPTIQWSVDGMAPLTFYGRPAYFAPVVSIFFFLFSSPNLSGRRLGVYTSMATHGVALARFRMQIWNVLHAARWKYRTQKWRKKIAICAPPNSFVELSLRKACINNREKNLLNGNISSICPHSMLNFGPLTAEIRWRVWGAPGNFNGFRVLASLLHQRRSTDVNQTLQYVWPSPALYIHCWGFCLLTEFCQL